MAFIPPQTPGDKPGDVPEPREPSGPLGDFTLGGLSKPQKKELEQLMGQLSIMGHLKSYNTEVFEHVHTFLQSLENQTPPLKQKMLKKVQEAQELTTKTLQTPSRWETFAPKLQALLHELA